MDKDSASVAMDEILNSGGIVSGPAILVYTASIHGLLSVYADENIGIGYQNGCGDGCGYGRGIASLVGLGSGSGSGLGCGETGDELCDGFIVNGYGYGSGNSKGRGFGGPSEDSDEVGVFNPHPEEVRIRGRIINSILESIAGIDQSYIVEIDMNEWNRYEKR